MKNFPIIYGSLFDDIQCRDRVEASNVFQALSKGEVVEHTRHLLVAPKCLQNKVLGMLDEEIAHARNGEEAYAGFKLNFLRTKRSSTN